MEIQNSEVEVEDRGDHKMATPACIHTHFVQNIRTLDFSKRKRGPSQFCVYLKGVEMPAVNWVIV